jgi:hypothetical protein
MVNPFYSTYTNREVLLLEILNPKYLFLSALGYKINPIKPFEVLEKYFIFAALKIRVLT